MNIRLLIFLFVAFSLVSKMKQIAKQNAEQSKKKPADIFKQEKLNTPKKPQTNNMRGNKPWADKAQSNKTNKAHTKNAQAEKMRPLGGEAKKPEFNFTNQEWRDSYKINTPEEKSNDKAAAYVHALPVNNLKAAVIMSEVLDKPVSLREKHLF